MPNSLKNELSSISRAFIATVSLLVLVVSAQAKPIYLYLTYPGDPSTSITVNYQTERPIKDSTVRYDTKSRKHLRGYSYQAEGTTLQVPGLPVERTIHTVTLRGLKPDTNYYFTAGSVQDGFTEERWFRTVPAGDEPIRFITGGDMDSTPLTQALLKQAAKKDPLFLVVGGDIAYANADVQNYKQWDRWFDNWEKLMITPNGRTIPVVTAIGNHETNKSDSPDPKERARFYFEYFGRQSELTYYERKFGSNIALFVLDSGHIAPHDGAQREWLNQALERNKDVPYRFAVYHVPLYPSHRDFEGKGSVLGRTHWLPLFDQYKLTAAFENHDHTFKRTHLLRGNQVSPDGTLYIGDGSFGVDPREIEGDLRWYEAKALQTGHFWVIDVTPAGVTYTAFGKDGELIDKFPE
ncbi:MAG: fibronectin type III domain-containing protein [Candidatus Hydrogenedentes bacterium]|nr:fibronectin type III domain-containing protein [Candidatus Hydrogenedentota bacterium]